MTKKEKFNMIKELDEKVMKINVLFAGLTEFLADWQRSGEDGVTEFTKIIVDEMNGIGPFMKRFIKEKCYKEMRRYFGKAEEEDGELWEVKFFIETMMSEEALRYFDMRKYEMSLEKILRTCWK